MAASFENNPFNLHPAHIPAWYVYTDANSSEPKFRYIGRITSGDDVTTYASWKTFPNIQDKTVFDASHVFKSLIESDEILANESLVHELGDIFGLPVSLVKHVKAVGSQEWAATLDDPATEQGTSASDSILIFAGAVGINFDLNDFKINTTDVGRFLTNSPAAQSIELDQAHTLTALNNDNAPFTLGSQPVDLRVNYYDAANTLLHSFTITNLAGNGGEPAGTAEDNECMLYVGAGTRNLEDYAGAGNKPSDHPTLSYYTINFEEEVIGVPTQSSEIKRFNVVTGDCKYDTVRVAFINTFGNWDYYNFTKRSDKRVQIERKQFTEQDGIYSDSDYTINLAQHGKKVYRQAAEVTYTLRSDWLTESEFNWLKEVIESPRLHLRLNGEWVGSVVNTASYDEQKFQNERLFNLEIEVAISDRNLNSIVGQ